jgi:hypothetical protein
VLPWYKKTHKEYTFENFIVSEKLENFHAISLEKGGCLGAVLNVAVRSAKALIIKPCNKSSKVKV